MCCRCVQRPRAWGVGILFSDRLVGACAKRRVLWCETVALRCRSRVQLGPPVRQHVVVYISARTASSGAPLRLQASEVAAAAWLPAADVARLVSGDVAEGDIVAGDASSGGAGAAAADAPSHVPCSLYDMHTRLAEGSRFALALWAAAAGAAAESKY